MTGYNFKLEFNKGYLEGKEGLLKRWKWYNFIRIIEIIFGIYEKWDCQILSPPKQNGDEWTYTIKLLRIKKYFLWINYANRAWNNIK